MSINPEQFSDANKATIDSLFAVANAALSSAQRIAELNLQTAHSILEDSAANAKALMGAKDVQETLAIEARLTQPAVEKAFAYSKSLYEISAQSQAELSDLLREQFNDFQRSSSRLLEQAFKTAPIGSEDAFASIQKAFTSAYSAFQNMNSLANKVK